jgi:hypothetical protein
VSKGYKLDLNNRNLAELADLPGAGELVDSIAKDVAENAMRMAPVYNKIKWETRAGYRPKSDGLKGKAIIAYYQGERTRGTGGYKGAKRRRAAIVAFHPSARGRAAGRNAIKRALAAATGMVEYTTKDGRTRWATQKQADAWTRSRTT